MATGPVPFCERCAGHPAGGDLPFSLIFKVAQRGNHLPPPGRSLLITALYPDRMPTLLDPIAHACYFPHAMTQAERFDAEQFAAALKRVGVPALKSNTYAHEMGLLASEVPEAVQCFRDVILRLADLHATLEARLTQAEGLVEEMTREVRPMAGLVLPTHKHEASDQHGQHHTHRN